MRRRAAAAASLLLAAWLGLPASTETRSKPASHTPTERASDRDIRGDDGTLPGDSVHRRAINEVWSARELAGKIHRHRSLGKDHHGEAGNGGDGGTGPVAAAGEHMNALQYLKTHGLMNGVHGGNGSAPETGAAVSRGHSADEQGLHGPPEVATERAAEQAGAAEIGAQAQADSQEQPDGAAAAGDMGGGGGDGEGPARTDWESFRSVGRVQRAHVDLEADGGMDAAVAARACEGEIIYFLAEDSFFTATLNLILNLHSLGLAHWLMLTSSEEACDTFERALNRVLPGEPSGCVWSQLHADNPGWEHHGLKVGTYKKLQILKMHYPAVLIERGLNVLLCDVDVAFPRSFYPDVKSGPFADRRLICQNDGYICNLGLVYSQNTNPAGPVHWLYAETTRRILEGLDPSRSFTSRSGKQVEPGPSSVLIWDQEIFGDSLMSAVMGAESRVGQFQSKSNKTEEEEEAVRKMSRHGKVSLDLTIPGTSQSEQAAIVRADDLLFISFPEYLMRYTSPALQEKQPMLHCVGAPRGPAKKFCLSAWGFWDFAVDRVGLNPGALGGVSEKLRTEYWLRLAPGHEPATRDGWLHAVRLLFQAAVVMKRRPIVPDIPCNSSGWRQFEEIHSGAVVDGVGARCLFNQVMMPESHACGPHADGTAVPQFMWDQIMGAGPARWRPAGMPTCGFNVKFVGVPAEAGDEEAAIVQGNKARALSGRYMRRNVGCLQIKPPPGAAAPPLLLQGNTSEFEDLEKLEHVCRLPHGK